MYINYFALSQFPMILGTYTFTEVFGIPYEWAEMPRWYIIAGQVSGNEMITVECYVNFNSAYYAGQQLG